MRLLSIYRLLTSEYYEKELLSTYFLGKSRMSEQLREMYRFGAQKLLALLLHTVAQGGGPPGALRRSLAPDDTLRAMRDNVGFGCADCYPYECAEAPNGDERKRQRPQRRSEALRRRLQFGLAGHTALNVRALQREQK